MFTFSPLPEGTRRSHYLSAASLFCILGFHVGVWAVKLAPLSASLGLGPAALGTAVTVAAASGLVTLFAGGVLADRAGTAALTPSIVPRARTTIYVMTMTRTTVYLSQDAKRRLTAAARRRHRSEAELIRDAVDQLLADEPKHPRPNPPQLDLDAAIIDNLDEHLSGGFGADGLEGASWHS